MVKREFSWRVFFVTNFWPGGRMLLWRKHQGASVHFVVLGEMNVGSVKQTAGSLV